MELHLLSKCLIIIILLHDSQALFGSSFKKLKNKAKQFYKSKFGKDKTWHFLGHDLSEYPGTKVKYLEINKQKWEEYYKCLIDQDKSFGKYLSVTPEAILGFEGNSIKLDCKICISPQERHQVGLVVWEWAPENGKYLEPIEFSEHVFVSPEDKTLHMYNLQVENTGQYMCRLGESLTAPYFLTVTNISDTEMVEVHSPEAPLGPYPTDPEVIKKYGLILDTEWSDWSTCSACGKIGKRYKVGYCNIFSKEHQEQKLTPTSNKTNETPFTNNTEETKVTDIDLELFSIFKLGIPCSSHILPGPVKELPLIKNRKNEIMMGYCKVRCPTNEIFEVKDKHGKVIEKANNSDGIYSLLQDLPPLEPPIERRLIYGVKGLTIILTCPGNLNTDAPIQWQISDRNLVPELISSESKGRIFISITDRIHIKKAKISDSNIYSCWQQMELAGTIRLIVEKKLQMNFSHHMMLLGIVIVLSVFLYVFLKAFAGRKYAKT